MSIPTRRLIMIQLPQSRGRKHCQLNTFCISGHKRANWGSPLQVRRPTRSPFPIKGARYACMLQEWLSIMPAHVIYNCGPLTAIKHIFQPFNGPQPCIKPVYDAIRHRASYCIQQILFDAACTDTVMHTVIDAALFGFRDMQ